jgi:hypothetical protein
MFGCYELGRLQTSQPKDKRSQCAVKLEDIFKLADMAWRVAMEDLRITDKA